MACTAPLPRAAVHGTLCSSKRSAPHIHHLPQLPVRLLWFPLQVSTGSRRSVHDLQRVLCCRPATGDRRRPLPPNGRPDVGGAAAEGGQAPTAAGGRRWHARRHDRRCPPSALSHALSVGLYARLTDPLTGVNQHAASRQTPSGGVQSKRQCGLTLTMGTALSTSRNRVSRISQGSFKYSWEQGAGGERPSRSSTRHVLKCPALRRKAANTPGRGARARLVERPGGAAAARQRGGRRRQLRAGGGVVRRAADVRHRGPQVLAAAGLAHACSGSS